MKMVLTCEHCNEPAAGMLGALYQETKYIYI